ncbi:Uma2 family endonuclease [Longimicrobium sp.]|uniref:Uma2 family endonuclease n=1 Tax=Longimicrobium sp. TaxID=2029185 RepID=UPI002F92AE35
MRTLMIEPEIEVDAKPQRRRFTVDEFQRMGEVGIFAPEERVELIKGEVVRMTPLGARHMEAVFALDDVLRSIVGPELRVSVQGAIRLPDSELHPDVALLRRSEWRKGQLPLPAACVLVIEVADSTVRFDRGEKRRDYARVLIPEYWVVDLPAESVVLHLQPSDGDYHQVTEHRRGSSFTSPALGGRTIAVDDVLELPDP